MTPQQQFDDYVANVWSGSADEALFCEAFAPQSFAATVLIDGPITLWKTPRIDP